MIEKIKNLDKVNISKINVDINLSKENNNSSNAYLNSIIRDKIEVESMDCTNEYDNINECANVSNQQFMQAVKDNFTKNKQLTDKMTDDVYKMVMEELSKSVSNGGENNG